MTQRSLPEQFRKEKATTSYPAGRDELARHLYIHGHDGDGTTESWRAAGAREWDAGQISPDDRDDCYRRADAILAAREALAAGRTLPVKPAS